MRKRETEMLEIPANCQEIPADCQIQINNDTKMSATCSVGGGIVVVQPGGKYQGPLLPLGPSQAPVLTISAALAAVAVKRGKR